MSNLTKQEKLRAQIAGLEGRTMASKLKKLMPVINQQLEDGVDHSQIVEALNENGVEVTLAYFYVFLYRWRKKHGKPDPSATAPQASHQGDQGDHQESKDDGVSVIPIEKEVKEVAVKQQVGKPAKKDDEKSKISESTDVVAPITGRSGLKKARHQTYDLKTLIKSGKE